MPEEIVFPFEKTEVYKNAYSFTSACRQICRGLGRGYYSDADQLSRASLSICNNTAEGYGRWHVRNKQQFYSIARGSAYECIPVLGLPADESRINAELHQNLRENIAEITKMLSGMIDKVGKRQ